MPHHACAFCKCAVSFALESACLEKSSTSCEALVEAWREHCDQIIGQGGGPVGPELCEHGVKLISVLCEHFDVQVVCHHLDAIASMLCHQVGVCP